MPLILPSQNVFRINADDQKICDKIPPIPDLAQRFLALSSLQSVTYKHIQDIEQDYPEFFKTLLSIINSRYFNLAHPAKNVHHAVETAGFDRVSHLLLCLVVYKTFNRLNVLGVDLKTFWEDSLSRGVSAAMIGETIGLDSDRCFTAGFLQDLGFLLLFHLNPKQGALWLEFRKREPEARYSMEANVFGIHHDRVMGLLCDKWGIAHDIALPMVFHHEQNQDKFETSEAQLIQVLNCADWLTSVYSAMDKNFVIDRCRKLLKSNFTKWDIKAEKLLSSLPDKIVDIASDLDIDVNERVDFSQILYEANIQLSQDNENFQELTLRLDQAIEERDRLANELNRELSLAREIQRSLLPPDMGSDYPLVGVNISARDLSGDFYDYFTLDDGRIYFNLGDVSGKGVNAALLMAKTSSLFRCLGKRIDDPEVLLSQINLELCETTIHGMFVTMIAGLYDPKMGTLKLVNAGNPPALLVSPQGLARELEAKGPPLGVLAEVDFPGVEIKLDDNYLYMFSDGVTEGYLENGEVMELSGLFKTIVKMDEYLQPIERLNAITDKLMHASIASRDDVTLLLLRANT